MLHHHIVFATFDKILVCALLRAWKCKLITIEVRLKHLGVFDLGVKYRKLLLLRDFILIPENLKPFVKKLFYLVVS